MVFGYLIMVNSINPVERLWGYIKYHLIRNKVYNSILDLENAVANFISQLTTEVVLSICSCNYLVI